MHESYEQHQKLENPRNESTLKYSPLFVIFDVSVNEETIHFGMYVFHGNLKAIETARFSNLNFLCKALHL